MAKYVAKWQRVKRLGKDIAKWQRAGLKLALLNGKT
jgi:hypothetical protein